MVVVGGIALACTQTHGTISPLLKPLFPFAYVALGLYLLAILGATTPIPETFGRRISFRDVAKSAGCMVLSLAIVILPFFSILAVGLFFLARSYFRRLAHRQSMPRSDRPSARDAKMLRQNGADPLPGRANAPAAFLSASAFRWRECCTLSSHTSNTATASRGRRFSYPIRTNAPANLDRPAVRGCNHRT
jgi:hypothetical protein